MKQTFTTTIRKDDEKDATGIQVPPEVVAALSDKKRPPVVVTVAGFTYRSTIAPYSGDLFMIPLSKERRQAAAVEAGDEVEVTLELDTAPRTVEVPDDLAAALAEHPGATAAFDALAPSARKEHVRQVESAKAAETRQRRIAKIVAAVTGSTTKG